MNNVTKLMKERGTIRQFDSSKEIPQEVMADILKATFQAPSYINGQQYTVILVTDQDKRDKLCEFTMPSSGKGMTFIKKAPVFALFVMDFNKVDIAMKSVGAEMKIQDSFESLLIGTVDVGIMVGAMTTAAESHGLGTVTVGAIRRATADVIKEFNLPEHTFPIVGVSLGYPAEGVSMVTRPRLPYEAMISYNTYSVDKFKEAIAAYEEVSKEDFASRGVDLTWTGLLSSYYTKAIFPENGEIYKKQGFTL